MAGQRGFEPLPTGFGVRCSNQLELLACTKSIQILSFFMHSMLTTEFAIFLQFVLTLIFTFIPGCRIISLFARVACKYNNFSWHNYSRIFDTTPAPTVCPPSRIAKRNSSSMAMGVSNSTVIVILSPGITISTPSGRFIVPVTSVVRK